GDSERGRLADEGPQHAVTITRPFYLCVHPVTQRQYETVVGHNPAFFNSANGGGPEHPGEEGTWEEAGGVLPKASPVLGGISCEESVPVADRGRMGVRLSGGNAVTVSLRQITNPVAGQLPQGPPGGPERGRICPGLPLRGRPGGVASGEDRPGGFLPAER